MRGLPSRGASVVPFSTMAPTSVFEKPSMRVYSSPKPNTARQQHESANQLQAAKSRDRRLIELTEGDANHRGDYPLFSRRCSTHPLQARDPANTGNLIPALPNVGATLHLVHRSGLRIDDPCPAAGLDYHEMARCASTRTFGLPRRARAAGVSTR